MIEQGDIAGPRTVPVRSARQDLSHLALTGNGDVCRSAASGDRSRSAKTPGGSLRTARQGTAAVQYLAEMRETWRGELLSRGVGEECPVDFQNRIRRCGTHL